MTTTSREPHCSAGVPPASSPSVPLDEGPSGETPPELAAVDGCATPYRSKATLRCKKTVEAAPERSERAHDVLRHARNNPLDAIFSPKTVAVIGASEKAGSVGCAVLNNLSAFDGKIYPVNPKHGSVLGIRAFPILAAVPEQVDLAVIVTPAPTVPGIIRECVQAAVRHRAGHVSQRNGP